MTSYDQLQATVAAEREETLVKGLVMTNLEDLENIPPAQWMVKGILAKGSMNMLHSTPKAGKTTLILSLLKATSDGGLFLGSQMEQGWSMLLSEQTHQSLAEQLRRAKIDGRSQIHVALRSDQSTAIDPELLAELLWNQYYRLNPAPSLIVIDTLARFIPMGDSNDYSGIIQKMEPLIANCGELGRRHEVTTILTHHSRKSTEGSDAQAVLGSTSIAAQPDTLLRLSVNRSTGNRRLAIESRYAQLDDPESVEMAIDQETGEYKLAVPHADLDELILEAVDDGYTTRRAVAEFLADKIENGDANKIVGRRLSALIKEGKLVLTGNGSATKYGFPT